MRVKTFNVEKLSTTQTRLPYVTPSNVRRAKIRKRIRARDEFAIRAQRANFEFIRQVIANEQRIKLSTSDSQSK